MSTESADHNSLENEVESSTNQAVAEGGAYEVLKKRLLEQAVQLNTHSQELNAARLAEFGSSEMAVSARVRVRTDNNCIARDIVQVGDLLLFGYNVFIGLKKETSVDDVFALFFLSSEGDAPSLSEKPLAGSFLSNTRFTQDFSELYRYYKHAKLVELTVKNGKLLMGFQIGERLEDLRVFRWSVSPDGQDVEYIDNRGERDIQLPSNYDFEWVQCLREDTVHGKHSHVNILDTVFIETTGGDLTVKIENNTEDGLGIYREEVEDKTQSIDDAEYAYSALGDLILVKVLPYKELEWRYFVFNRLTESVTRIDAIGDSCVQLPEDHGIVFPGGYYLQSGEYKTYDEQSVGLKFKRMIKSPNGEDVLYVFYEPLEGIVGLLAYNMIDKKLANPIFAHGYALSENGLLIVFSAEQEPTRVHPMQIWETPYYSDEHASKSAQSNSFLGRIGNAPLVRGISDLLSVCRTIENQSVSVRLYEELSKSALKVFDNHFWVGNAEAGPEYISIIAQVLRDISDTAELAIDEFKKVESIRKKSVELLRDAQQTHNSLVAKIRTASWDTAEDYVFALDELRKHSGHLNTIKSARYIDVKKISLLESKLVEINESLSRSTADFLADEASLKPYYEKINSINAQVAECTTNAQLKPLIETVEQTAAGLDLLSELLVSLKVDDTTIRTRIIDSISEVYSLLNQSKADAQHKRKNMGSAEATAEFSAQFKLFTQSINNALGLANTPEACDEQMSRLLVQLEDLESQFSEYEEFLVDIVAKRDEVYEIFEAHKQYLLDEQGRKTQAIADAAQRILTSIEKRTAKFNTADELNTYFASDNLVRKVREFIEQLRDLNAAVSADDTEAKLKAIVEQAMRVLRDKTDIYESGGKVIKLGPRHKFSVNTQELDLSIIPRNDKLSIHLSGTDYFEEINDPKLMELQAYWNAPLISESREVYRAEFLAFSIMRSAKANLEGLNEDILNKALLDKNVMLKLVREFATPRYKEGYEKGIHDQDAVEILLKVIPAVNSADLLIFDPLSRGLAQVFWANIQRVSEQLQSRRLTYETWIERAQSAQGMRDQFKSSDAHRLLAAEIYSALSEFLRSHPIDVTEVVVRRAADYLVYELGRERCEFIGSKYAIALVDELKRSLDDESWRRFQLALEKMMGWPSERWNLSCAWLNALIEDRKLAHLSRYIPEAAALINSDERIDRRITEVDLKLKIEPLRGEHERVENRCLEIEVDEFYLRLEAHSSEFVSGFNEFQQVRQQISERERKVLRLHEFRPRPLSSFVRNRLINESYLPIIGDNLAKQMGTVGENKRTDLMGLLMMISPPGYGKTTLMEYVASRLGLIFMKINCPSLGHDVLSLDPEQAPNATSRQELEKLNLGLEMGNNVMLYLDDIQHTNPEFLQKFISLCDGTRIIEGIWKGETKTYNLRGKKFCVVMAGNPYTESGDVFRIPDMLANRADIYNLGDILGGMDEQFALSYLENSLTSNAVLAPLATREINDVYLLIKLAEGKDVATTDLSYQYSGAEINEIVDVFKKLFVIRDVILRINQQYIASAAQAEKYRTEPAFKLQGSYRNMNKMAEKVSAVMNQSELMQLIQDHYQGEAQLLTTGAEENLLKLAELRGNLTEEQQSRRDQIKKDFLRNKAMGGDDADVGSKVVAQLADMVDGIRGLATEKNARVEQADNTGIIQESIKRLIESVDNLGKNQASKSVPKVEVVNQPVPGIDKLLAVLANTIENSIFPLVRSMDKKLEIDLRTHDKMTEVSNQLRQLEHELETNVLQNPVEKASSRKTPARRNKKLDE